MQSTNNFIDKNYHQNKTLILSNSADIYSDQSSIIASKLHSLNYLGAIEENKENNKKNRTVKMNVEKGDSHMQKSVKYQANKNEGKMYLTTSNSLKLIKPAERNSSEKEMSSLKRVESSKNIRSEKEIRSTLDFKLHLKTLLADCHFNCHVPRELVHSKKEIFSISKNTLKKVGKTYPDICHPKHHQTDYQQTKQTQNQQSSLKNLTHQINSKSKVVQANFFLKPNYSSIQSANYELILKKNQKKYESNKLQRKLNISDFSIGQSLGEGAFGEVFLGIHKQSKWIVAIKKIGKEKVRHISTQFIDEIKIQMFLNNPNIVKLYGFFDDSTHFYMIMEYMEGGSLYGEIKRKKKLGEKEAGVKLRQICLGLMEMHEKAIIHRDIKPENIVMTQGVCKICDFGWAAHLTHRRTTYCGTLDYVSPEILEGEKYDQSVDIWCLGVLAFEMICGKTPFYNISRKETLQKIKNAKYDYHMKVSTQARSFIDHILQKDPQRRVDIESLMKSDFLREKEGG